jgi:hypothetical protein
MKGPQVFVDESGRRARWILFVETLVGLAAVAMSVLVVITLAGSG